MKNLFKSAMELCLLWSAVALLGCGVNSSPCPLNEPRKLELRFSGLEDRFAEEDVGDEDFFFLEKTNLGSMVWREKCWACGERLLAAYGSFASPAGVKGRE